MHTHEEVVGVRIWPPNSEKFHQIVKLAMYISAYCYWTFLDFHLVFTLQNTARKGLPRVARSTRLARLPEPRYVRFSFWSKL